MEINIANQMIVVVFNGIVKREMTSSYTTSMSSSRVPKPPGSAANASAFFLKFKRHK
jgi:hypothetical protein